MDNKTKLKQITESVAQDLEHLRLYRKITRKDLAGLSGKKPSAITAALSGDKPLTIRTIVSLAAAMGFEPVISFKEIKFEDEE